MKKILWILFIISVVGILFTLSSFRNKVHEEPVGQTVFNVLEYGAVGDGVTLDSPAIQKAIDAAAEEGGGARVLIPGGHRYLVGTLNLPGGIDFHLAEGAELLVSTDAEDYIDRALIRTIAATSKSGIVI